MSQHSYNHRGYQTVTIPFNLPDGTRFFVRANYCPICGQVTASPDSLAEYRRLLDEQTNERNQRPQKGSNHE